MPTSLTKLSAAHPTFTRFGPEALRVSLKSICTFLLLPPLYLHVLVERVKQYKSRLISCHLTPFCWSNITVCTNYVVQMYCNSVEFKESRVYINDTTYYLRSGYEGRGELHTLYTYLLRDGDRNRSWDEVCEKEEVSRS